MQVPEKGPDKPRPPRSREVDPEVKLCVRTILQELEFRRQLLTRKIPLSMLERPYRFTLK